MRHKLKAVLVVAAGIGAGLAFATPAAADPPTQTVVFKTADLENPESLAAVYQRIEAAASTVCRQANLGVDNWRAAVASCEERAVAIALEEAALPALSAYHEELHERGGAPVSVAAR